MSELESLGHGEEKSAASSSTSSSTSSSGLIGSATLLAIGSAASRALGLAREVMITSLFGATGEVSAFRIAAQVPVLLYDFLIGGMLSAALVPVLSQYAQRERRAEFGRLIGVLAAILGVILLVLLVALEVAAPQLAWLLAGGLAEFDPALLALTVRLLRMALPVVWFMSMAGLATAALYALERFSFPALAISIYNLGMLIVAPMLAARLGITALVVGMLVGTVAQVVVMGLDLWRAGVRVRLHLQWRHPALRQILKLYGPIAAGLLVAMVQVGLDRRLATSTQPESVAWMANATTLQQLPLGLISVAISLAALPRLSQYFALGDEERYHATLEHGLRIVMLLIVPAAMALWVLGEPLVRVFFERNLFTPADTAQVAAALDIYVVGMLFAAIDYPLNLAFYARHNTHLPALIGVVSVGFYLVAAWALMTPLGFLGLVWADTAKHVGHMVIMLVLMRWQLGGRAVLWGRGVLWIVLAGLGAGMVMATLAQAAGRMMDGVVAPGAVYDLLLLGGAGAGGLLAYGLLLTWARVPEWELVRDRFLMRGR